MAIYTRKGDKGETSLRKGQKIFKSHLRVCSYGNIDELNSALGVVLAKSKNKEIKDEVFKIQNDLFEIGASLASPSDRSKNLSNYLGKRIVKMEKSIDSLTEKIPTLSNFILPGGGESGAFLHLARTICRRVERKIVKLSKKEKIEVEIIAYLNRLSDHLFTLARFANVLERQKETIWIKKTK